MTDRVGLNKDLHFEVVFVQAMPRGNFNDRLIAPTVLANWTPLPDSSLMSW